MPQTTSRPVRVLHVINGEHYSGGERVQDILGEYLPRFGYEVGFACLKPDMFPRYYRARSCPVHELPMKGKLDLSPIAGLRRLIREHGYRIVHSHMPRTVAPARLASLLEGVPFVHHIHSPTLLEGPSKIKNLIFGTMERLCLVGSAEVIACSAGMGRYVKRIGIDTARATTVLNGIPGLGRAEDLPPPSPEWIFGMVALFRERKGLEFLLHAMRSIKDSGLRFRLRAIGGFKSEDYRRQILALVDELGVGEMIDWVGFTDDVPGELRKLHFFVLPSTGGEGLPIAILEAMSAGLPIVTTDVPGNDEVVRDGVDGYLCKPEDSVTLAQRLVSMMGSVDGWRSMADSAYRRQRETFSAESMTAGVARVYDRLIPR